MAGSNSALLARVPAPASTRRHGSLLWAAAIGALAALVLLAGALAFRSHPLVPYSPADRRMTFAVLPFVSPAGEAGALAASSNHACTVALERNTTWARLADPADVANAAARFTAPRDIARALGVHFLVQGVVKRADEGYRVELSVLDGATGQVLGSGSVAAAESAPATASRSGYDDTLADLIYLALQSEVQRVQKRATWELDVRDLTWRAYVHYYQHLHAQPQEAYETAQQLLERALRQSPDDYLALYTVAQINLCDCLSEWLADPSRATQIGAAAVDRLVRLDRRGPPNRLRAKVLQLQGRWPDLLSLSDQALRLTPDDPEFLESRIVALLHLGRASEALAITPALERRNLHGDPAVTALIADAEYTAGLYAPAIRHAESALGALSPDALASRITGPLRLTLAAAQARLGKQQAARASLDTFWQSVPQARSLAAIRAWMYPSAHLYGVTALAEGLRLAGVPD